MLVPEYARIPALTSKALANVRKLTVLARAQPQTQFVTEHWIHGCIYKRAVLIPVNQLVTGVLIKVPTYLTIVGNVTMYTSKGPVEFNGVNVVPGSIGRASAFLTNSVVWMSMEFSTKAKTVEDAQKEFTDEVDMLVPLSQADAHRIVITGE
jgi:hypothetical protein